MTELCSAHFLGKFSENESKLDRFSAPETFYKLYFGKIIGAVSKIYVQELLVLTYEVPKSRQILKSDMKVFEI